MNPSLAIVAILLMFFQGLKARMLTAEFRYMAKYSRPPMPRKWRRPIEAGLSLVQVAAIILAVLANGLQPIPGTVSIAAILGLLMIIADAGFTVWYLRTLDNNALLGRLVFFGVYMTMLIWLVVDGIIVPMLRTGTT